MSEQGAVDGIEQLDFNTDDTLLITGSGGGVGAAAAQLAKRLGVTVIGPAELDEARLIESLGAVHVTYENGTRIG